MAIELSLNGRIPVSAIQAAVRTALPHAREDPGDRAVVSNHFTEHLWVSVGEYAGECQTPAGELQYDTFAYFRMDKFALRESTEAALGCIRAILERSDADCALVYLSDITLLVRVGGVARAFAYHDGDDFWDVYDVERLLGPGVQVERVARAAYEETEDEPDDEEEEGWAAEGSAAVEAGGGGERREAQVEKDRLIGLVVDGAYRIEELLGGGGYSARFRGSAASGPHKGQRVLLTTTTRPDAVSSFSLDPFRLAGVPRVAPQICASVCNEVFPHFVYMVELEPVGVPLSELDRVVPEADAYRLGRDLCKLAADAATTGVVLGGIRPELTYCLEDLSITGVAPRAFAFNASGAPRSHWVGPPFATCFEPPELRWQKPVEATDVYMIAATVFYVIHGEPPFRGNSWLAQRDASLEEPPRRYHGDRRVGAVITNALAPQSHERPSLSELTDAMASS